MFVSDIQNKANLKPPEDHIQLIAIALLKVNWSNFQISINTG